MSQGVETPERPEGRRWIRNEQDFWGGIALIALALFAMYASSDLPGQRGFAFGPGTAPRLFAGVLLFFGLIITVVGAMTDGPKIGGYAVRGPLMITCALLVFAAIIRPVGLIAASFLTFMISVTASRETRYLEATITAVAMTAFCVFLFVYMLNLPFQLWPRWFF
jgi:putative tricarboxylic transport membrane protein